MNAALDELKQTWPLQHCNNVHCAAFQSKYMLTTHQATVGIDMLHPTCSPDGSNPSTAHPNE